MTEYKKIDESAWLKFGKDLSQEGTEKKISDTQIEFLEACRNGKDDFLRYLDNNLLQEGIISGEKNVHFKHRFTEVEFCYPPMDTQKVIWDVFSKLPKENMTLCGFWGHVIIDMIKHDCIEPDYLASNGANDPGVSMLDNAINSYNGQKIDDCARRVLRSMGCPPPGRGKRIIFNDFYLGKSYWRWNWANKMSGEIGLSPKEILKIFDETSYSEFYQAMFAERSYISQTNTLGGLLLFLKDDPLKEDLKKVINRIAYLSAWKAIEIQSPKLNKQEIQRIVHNL